MMERISALSNAEAPAAAQPMLEDIEKQMGTVPNLMRTMAHSPAVLESYLGFSSTLGKGKLPGRLREQLALAVGQANGCDYCLAAHSALGRAAGLSDEEIADSRRGQAPESKTAGALRFAQRVVATKGHVNDEEIAALRDAGFADGEILEIVANVALNIFTNYFNHVAGTVVDFPAAAPLETAAFNAS